MFIFTVNEHKSGNSVKIQQEDHTTSSTFAMVSLRLEQLLRTEIGR